MKVRYFVLGMLVLLSVITYLDRICIGVAGTAIQEDLGITKEQWGWVLGAFLLSYGIFEIPTGAWGDKLGQRRILTRIVLWWSVFTALTPLARNYYLLVAVRFLFGAGEAGAYPNASGSISRWFPFVERARAQGLVWGASRLGGALTPLLVIPLMTHVGWQSCFWIFGILGVVWAGAWVWWYRDTPAEHPAVSAAELQEILPVRLATPTPDGAELPGRSLADPAIRDREQGVETTNPYQPPRTTGTLLVGAGAEASAGGHRDVPWGRLIASPQVWLIIAMYWFYVFGFIFFMYWLPEFLTVGRGMSKEAMGFVVAAMFTMGAVGNVFGGFASDALTKRYGLAWGRKLIGASCLAISGCLMFAVALTPGQYAAAALIILAFGICDAMLPCSWAICIDVGRQYSGAVSGAMNSSGQAAGFLCTVLYGYLIEAFGYDVPLMFLAPSMIISAVFFLLIDPTRSVVAEPKIVSPAAEEPVCV